MSGMPGLHRLFAVAVIAGAAVAARVDAQPALTGDGGTLALASWLGTPPTIDLGSVAVGASASRAFVLRNEGTVAIDPVTATLTPTPAGGVFEVTPGATTIGPSGTRTLEVRCTPTAGEAFSTTLELTAPTALAGSPLVIELRCAGTTGDLHALPSSIDLGEIRLGADPVIAQVALHTAAADLTLSEPPALASPAPAGVSVAALSGPLITQDSPATFDLVVEPTIEADLATEITVTAGTSVTIPVTGKVVRAEIQVPEQIMVGSFCVGQSTTPAEGSLTASGTATIALSAQPAMAKMSASPFQLTYRSPVAYPYPLPAGHRAIIEVTALRQSTPGVQTDELVWTTDAPQTPSPRTRVTAEFIATGGAIAPQLVDFGSVPLREDSSLKEIRIQNCGTDAIALAPPRIEPSGEFRDDSAAPLPTMLMPMQTASIAVAFSPQRPGPRMATLIVDSSKGPLRVNLLGQGVGDAGTDLDETSFYGCDGCATRAPGGAWPLALAVVVVLIPRRRRGSRR